MKKRKWIIAAVVLFFLMLIPVRLQLRDGGTVIYRSVLYEITDRRCTHVPSVENGADTYVGGVIIRVLGVELYNSVPS